MLGLSVIILFKSFLHVFCSLVFSAHNSSGYLLTFMYFKFHRHSIRQFKSICLAKYFKRTNFYCGLWWDYRSTFTPETGPWAKLRHEQLSAAPGQIPLNFLCSTRAYLTGTLPLRQKAWAPSLFEGGQSKLARAVTTKDSPDPSSTIWKGFGGWKPDSW